MPTWSTPATSLTCSTWLATSRRVTAGLGWLSIHAARSARTWPRPGTLAKSNPRRFISSPKSRSQSRQAWETNAGTKFTMQVPPLPGSRARISSGTFLG